MLKQAGRHPNIVNLIGTWIQGGETYFDYPNNILVNLRKKYLFIHVMKFTGQGDQVARKLDLAEILKTNISKELCKELCKRALRRAQFSKHMDLWCFQDVSE